MHTHATHRAHTRPCTQANILQKKQQSHTNDISKRTTPQKTDRQTCTHDTGAVHLVPDDTETGTKVPGNFVPGSQFAHADNMSASSSVATSHKGSDGVPRNNVLGYDLDADEREMQDAHEKCYRELHYMESIIDSKERYDREHASNADENPWQKFLDADAPSWHDGPLPTPAEGEDELFSFGSTPKGSNQRVYEGPQPPRSAAWRRDKPQPGSWDDSVLDGHAGIDDALPSGYKGLSFVAAPVAVAGRHVASGVKHLFTARKQWRERGNLAGLRTVQRGGTLLLGRGFENGRKAVR
jgi:hypothetical protein